MKIEMEISDDMIINILTEDAKTQVWHIHNTLHELSKEKEIYHIQDLKHHFETLQAFNTLLQYYGGDVVPFEETDWKPEEEKDDDPGCFSSGATLEELKRTDELIYGTVQDKPDPIPTSEELDAETLADFSNSQATVEDLARAWASIDGKLSRFDLGKASKAFDEEDGTYSGYCVEAREILERAARYAKEK